MKKFLIRILFSDKERSLMKKIFEAERLRLFIDKTGGYCESKVMMKEIYKIEEKISKP